MKMSSVKQSPATTMMYTPREPESVKLIFSRLCEECEVMIIPAKKISQGIS
jgi:hypothetical protein